MQMGGMFYWVNFSIGVSRKHRKKSPRAIVQSLGNRVQGNVLNKKRKKRAYNPQEKY